MRYEVRGPRRGRTGKAIYVRRGGRPKSKVLQIAVLQAGEQGKVPGSPKGVKA